MKFNYLKINGYGKLKDKQIDFGDKINILYGKNEAGKSTISRFIINMLYGASKNKKGKEISDYDKFLPWQGEEFSGKISYTLDNNKKYEIYREFKKKAPKVFNSEMEEISDEFKNKGAEFFEEQLGIDEDTFVGTAMIEQDESQLSDSSQANLIQKISNQIQTGEDNTSFKKAMDRINKAQLDRVGTSKSSQKPLNIVENRIHKLEIEIKEENNLDNLEKIKGENEEIQSQIETEEIKLEALKEYKKKLDDNKIKNVEININKNIKEEYNEKIEELQNKINSGKENKKLNIKNALIVAIGVLLLLNVVLFIFLKNKWILFVSGALLIAEIITFVLKFISKKSEIKENTELQKQLSSFKNAREEELKELENKNIELENVFKEEVKQVLEKFNEKLDSNFIETVLAMDNEETEGLIDKKEKNINDLKIRKSVNEKEILRLDEEKEKSLRLEEELKSLYEEKDELEQLNRKYNIAKECLNDAYIEMKEGISPVFEENLSSLVSKISDDEYKKVKFDDKTGLTVEINNGNYVSANRLSIGTLDQMYLSLRLSALKEISRENIPIFFDESFVYYDDNRLENILKYIAEELDNQVIIFTCSKREIEVLEKLQINYNLINL